ncbi:MULTISPECIES: hypothetical protein [Mammaliicoccus]|uniref:hypothetical protein n=1 Tax=Mammaliicoccus TaxID=2803850 RepID=UPI000E01BB89|nr:hypothetical protein [Mammaliicoccus fleurettii]RTX84805.1 hypothetical protein CD129_11810 [Mammaliicoccus fleurettii]SUM35421.1 Lauroyl/myristoyl acyltransferase [Mammaliicoccus fleurettii]HCN60708.1 hypothetical protein [Staphylococcus sp.]
MKYIYKLSDREYKDRFFSTENFVSKYEIFYNLLNNLNNEELYRLFNSINDSQNTLIEHNFYDYKHKVYNNIFNFEFSLDKQYIAKEMSNYLKTREMNIAYYMLLIGKGNIDISLDNSLLHREEGCVVNLIHYGLYQIVPYIFAKNTEKDIIIYANTEITKALIKMMCVIEKKVPKNLIILSLEYKSVIKAMKMVKRGAILIVMPEIDLGSSQKKQENKAKINFFGKKLLVPIGTQKIASKTGVDSYSLCIEEQQSKILVDISKININSDVYASVVELWDNIEKTVKNKPYKWTIWERIDELLYEE